MPHGQMKGEFDNFDPIGIAAGARIKADCSINWIDPDDGARFASRAARPWSSSGRSQGEHCAGRAGWLKPNH